MSTARLESLVKELLVELGEDPDREGLERSPHRIATSLQFLTEGYRVDIDRLINNAIFTSESNNMIIVRDIELYSLCEHHMLPFFGRVHIGYIPRAKVFGLSKLARIVDMFARRLQMQERITQQVAEMIMNKIEPEGVGVIIEARHLCMMMRGVQKQNSMMTTSAVLGSFRVSSTTRNEFLELIRRGSV